MKDYNVNVTYVFDDAEWGKDFIVSALNKTHAKEIAKKEAIANYGGVGKAYKKNVKVLNRDIKEIKEKWSKQDKTSTRNDERKIKEIVKTEQLFYTTVQEMAVFLHANLYADPSDIYKILDKKTQQAIKDVEPYLEKFSSD